MLFIDCVSINHAQLLSTNLFVNVYLNSFTSPMLNDVFLNEYVFVI